MIGLRSTSRSTLLMTTSLLFCQISSPASVLAKTVEGSASCTTSSLPSGIQDRLTGTFGSWKVLENDNLSEHARKTWEGKKPLACPGIAVGLFQNAKTPSYAVLLVPIDRPDARYRFLVFSRKVRQPSYETIVVEQSDDHGASNYFIRKVAINRFFNEESKKTFQVQAMEGILMIDSAEQEYEADVYFWSNGRFRQEAVDE
jgi:hypothetical protein